MICQAQQNRMAVDRFKLMRSIARGGESLGVPAQDCKSGNVLLDFFAHNTLNMVASSVRDARATVPKVTIVIHIVEKTCGYDLRRQPE